MFYKAKVLTAVTDEVYSQIATFTSRKDVEQTVNGYLLYNDFFKTGFKMMSKQGKRMGMSAQVTALMVIDTMSNIFDDVGEETVKSQPPIIQNVINAVHIVAASNKSLTNPLGV